MARPTNLTPELLVKCKLYLDGAWAEEGDVVPSIAGLAVFLGVTKVTLHEWKRKGVESANSDDVEQFSYYYEQCQVKQEQKLINCGLTGDFTPAIAKMLLAGHGHSDKIEQAHTSPDGSMTPTIIQREVIDPVKD